MRRRAFLAVLANISAFTAVGSVSLAEAAGLQDRYCLQGRQWGYPGNCQFTNYFQCMASAGGTGAQCRANPRYPYARKRPALSH